MKTKRFIISMLSEGSEVSVKRVITLSAFVLLALAFLFDMFLDIKVSDGLMDIMETIVMTGFTATVVEKFANNPKPDPVVENKEKTLDQPELPIQ